jgi:hypothetical protein
MGKLTRFSLDFCRKSKTIFAKFRKIILSTIMGFVPAAWPTKYNSDQA